jgi:hypothetical protein
MKAETPRARLYQRCRGCSQVNPMPPWTWMARSHAATAASAALALAAAAATGASETPSETAHADQ